MLLALLWNPRPRGSRVARRLNICCVFNSSWRISRVPSGWTELKLRSYLSTCRSRYVTPLVSIWLCCFVHSCLASSSANAVPNSCEFSAVPVVISQSGSRSSSLHSDPLCHSQPPTPKISFFQAVSKHLYPHWFTWQSVPCSLQTVFA